MLQVMGPGSDPFTPEVSTCPPHSDRMVLRLPQEVMDSPEVLAALLAYTFVCGGTKTFQVQ